MAVPKAYPAEFPEQHAARFPLRLAPCPIRTQHGDRPVRGETQRAATCPSAPQLAVFPGRRPDPDDTGKQPHPQVCWQLEDNKGAGEPEQHARPGDKPTQARIRLDFG